MTSSGDASSLRPETDLFTDPFLVSPDTATSALSLPDEIIQTAARLLAEHLNVNRCAYADVEDDEDTFNLTGDYNRGVSSIVGRYRFRAFGAECLRLMRAGETYVVEDAENDPHIEEERASYRLTAIRALVCVPVMKAGKFVCVLAVHQAAPRQWTSRETELVEIVANRSWESIERMRVSRDLQESERRYRFLTQSIPQMVWTARPDGALDYVSDQVSRYFNAPSARVLGEGWLQWVHPEDQEATVERWKSSLATGTPYETAFRLLRAADRSWRWHLVRAEPLAGEDGKIAQWFGTCTDIENQKRTEAMLAEQARISALGSDIGAALTQVANLKDSLQRCAQALVDRLDAAFARIWLLSPKEQALELQASAGLYTHINGGHSRIPVGLFKIGKIALSRRPHLTNTVVEDMDAGDRAWARREGMVAFAGYPLVVEDRLIGVLGLFARHALRPDTLAALASISATVAIGVERKRSGEELARYAEELKRSNEDLEQFAHVASHDLQSPLNTVLQFTGLIMRRHGASIDPEMNQFLQIVQDSATRMGELISARLSYARLNDSQSKELKPVSSRAAYDQAVANLRASIDEAQALIESDELPEVLSHPNQLLQVFQNLIGNAIHYRGSTAPRVRVSAERQDGCWLFSVADNGQGINPQYHSMIFEPFKRLHGSDRPGSGIGLAFCRNFIEREGGRIWVESGEGQGATFRFTLSAVERTAAGAR
jgi:PAS domain S-box-containing protein